MANFRPLVIALLIFGVLAAAMISFGIQLATQNESNRSISNDPSINSYAQTLETDLETGATDAANIERAFGNSSVSTTGGVIFLDVLGGLWKSMVRLPNQIFKGALSLVKANLAGGSTEILYVFGIIFLIMVVTIVIAVWKLISTGDGG